ncbi:exonuclease domain-containing protein [Methylocystis echinoides]|uniref:exonuclease domain-containing protein n=1 Tax=Methylocystis echinoides TaxID=29468 RepID=UPI00343484C7
MPEFIVIDIETANSDISSICAVGLVHFKGGQLFNSLSFLVDPETHFSRKNISIHGIRPEDVVGKPKMREIFPLLLTVLDGHVIAHHTHFDRSALKKISQMYGFPELPVTWVDTAAVVRGTWDRYARSGYGLGNLAEDLGIEFQHHDPREDARAAGLILVKALTESGLSLNEWISRTGSPIRQKSNKQPTDGNALIHADHRGYFAFTKKSRIDKAINTLSGIIHGITIDAEINPEEIEFLHRWLEDHRFLAERHPFNEVIPIVHRILLDGVITEDEKEDLTWVFGRLQSTEYADRTAAHMQRLHAILSGIASDGRITTQELIGLSAWLSEHEHLATIWPYDEIKSVVTDVLSDGKIEEAEHRMLLSFFQEFTAILDDRTIRQPTAFDDGQRLVGVCAVKPKIRFGSETFCLTGKSFRYSREEFTGLIKDRGGRVVSSMSSKVGYLIVGSDGNPCWMYACYGRKVEKAVELRKAGARVLIVHENDFHDAVKTSD